MALALAYVNEVLNHVPSTVVVDEDGWKTLIAAFKFEGRDLEKCVLGLMRLRMAPGGFEGMQKELNDLLTENAALKAEVDALKATSKVAEPELVHGG